MGKRMFEQGEVAWPEEAPFHSPVYVLTHQKREPWVRPGGTTFCFVNDGPERALEQAGSADDDRRAPIRQRRRRQAPATDAAGQSWGWGLDWLGMPGDLVLLPVPRRLEYAEGAFALRAGQAIDLFCTDPAAAAAGRVVHNALGAAIRVAVRSGDRPGTDAAVRIRIEPGDSAAQGYRLTIGPRRIELVGASPSGAFYGAQTLMQIVRQCPGALPALRIVDHPDFPARGVMLDISRDKVPTMATLYALVDQLAAWKINQLQLYMEHTFAYANHRDVWQDASPMTPQEIRELDAYCRQRFIELVPNQNSFGHMERWLRLPRYIDLAEAPYGSDMPSGKRWNGPFSLCPTDPRSIELLRELYAELLPNFGSRLINVGCDETFDIGQGRSKAAVAQRGGTTRVYLDFLRQVHELVNAHGRRMMFWGDMIIKQPQLIDQLPPDVIALEWGYEADHPFDRDGEHFQEAGIPFYVCPGTSSWCSIAGRTDNAIANLRNAATHGRAHGAIGYLNTDWGDYGHLQYLPVSYLGLMMGGAYSWSAATAGGLGVARALDVHAFGDAAGVMGNVAVRLGNVYQACGQPMKNGSALFRALLSASTGDAPAQTLSYADLQRAHEAIDQAIAPVPQARMNRADAGLIVDELIHAAAMLKHACKLVHYRLDGHPRASASQLAHELAWIIEEHRRLWMARNRPGGLADSVARLTAIGRDYGIMQ